MVRADVRHCRPGVTAPRAEKLKIKLLKIRQGLFALLRSLCPVVTLYADENDQALAIGEFFNRTRGLARHPFDLVHPAAEDGTVEPLDLDVINTSFLEDNVPKMRHINLPANLHVVDDLRELVLTKKRASHRRRASRMTQLGKAANVYSFLAAPGHVNKELST